MYILIGIVLVVIITLILNVKIVPQSNAYVIERLGGYLETWQVGLNFKIPLVDRIASKVSLKERVVDFPPQPVITKDNVTMKIDTVVYYQITDPKLFAYGVDNPINAIENLTATTLRNIIGQLELDESLSSRDLINTQMRSILDEATDPWGIKVNRVEVKNIEPPRDIQEAMEKQMRAEREKREAILRAEGKKTSSILNAQGRKESAIEEAEGEKQSQILRAEGKAKAHLIRKESEAKGLKLIKNVGVNEEILALKQLESLAELGRGNATKIIVPTDITSMASSVTMFSDLFKGDDKATTEIKKITKNKE